MNKNYKAVKSIEPSKNGRHYLTAWTSDDTKIDDPWDFPHLKEIAEKYFYSDLIEVIENCLFLRKSTQTTGFIQTLKLYETPEGDIVEIANDDFEGIIVESENAEIIDKIYERLLKI